MRAVHAGDSSHLPRLAGSERPVRPDDEAAPEGHGCDPRPQPDLAVRQHELDPRGATEPSLPAAFSAARPHPLRLVAAGNVPNAAWRGTSGHAVFSAVPSSDAQSVL